MKLTNDQHNAINKLASYTKIDTWFWLSVDNNDQDIIIDLESEDESVIDWEEGLTLLRDSIISEDTYDYARLTKKEKKEMKKLFKKYNIEE